eukprot:TRINITY_DN9783_c0_g1_i1.p1 TRINITY_DN9783_c0_g1~~TRINITY_DN9783_c0_g1_i1.p1  ORF type:complete len:181 (-),score=50.98 TRINITY_DN9783_c0_g1_i1:72-614(-)
MCSINDEQFRRQFNPQDESHHKGSPVPFPIGGDRVPEGMEDDKNWQSRPEVERTTENFGDEYDRVFAIRAKINDAKKAITQMNFAVDACGRSNSEKAVAKRDEQIVAFETIRAHFVDYQEGAKVHDFINSVISKAKLVNSPNDEDAYQDFVKATGVATRGCASEQRALLAKLKEIKKQQQ